MKKKLAFIRKFYVKAKLVIHLIVLLIILSLASNNAFGKPQYSLEYTDFLEDYECILMLKPDIIREVFLGLVDLKGNRSVSRKKVSYDVLGCRTNSGFNQGCYITKITRKKRDQKVSNYLKINVNFADISIENFTKGKKLIVLHWEPELTKPVLVEVDFFLKEVSAARESKYYKVKQGINQFQFNSILEKEIRFIAENKLAHSLINVYKEIPEDENDAIFFKIDHIIKRKRYQIMDYFIHFRADKVFINHQMFKTIEKTR